MFAQHCILLTTDQNCPIKSYFSSDSALFGKKESLICGKSSDVGRSIPNRIYARNVRVYVKVFARIDVGGDRVGFTRL